MVLLTYSVKMTQIKTQMQSKKTNKQTCSGNMKNAFLYHFIFFDTKLRYCSYIRAALCSSEYSTEIIVCHTANYCFISRTDEKTFVIIQYTTQKALHNFFHTKTKHCVGLKVLLLFMWVWGKCFRRSFHQSSKSSLFITQRSFFKYLCYTLKFLWHLK